MHLRGRPPIATVLKICLRLLFTRCVQATVLKTCLRLLFTRRVQTTKLAPKCVLSLLNITLPQNLLSHTPFQQYDMHKCTNELQSLKAHSYMVSSLFEGEGALP